jgi:hypothetical protein
MKQESTAEGAALPVLPARSGPDSGLYTYSLFTRPIPTAIEVPTATPTPGAGSAGPSEADEEASAVTPLVPLLISFEELRLDVDGYYPQMKASGQISGFKLRPANWIANVAKTAANTYEGKIWYKDGNVGLIPQTTVRIEVTRTFFAPKSAKATFSGGGAPDRVRTFQFKSRYFHQVNFEFDAAEGVTPVLSYDTGSHPNRPASLPVQNLSIATVYRRAGFDVSISGGGDIVPIAEALADAKWNDTEMHDAMQAHWTKFANAPQWALWVFFASLHEMGTGLGGIMFDDIGPNHRQGTSLFLDSFIKDPKGDPTPAAFVNRMIFWTACHEMGHSFNLAHSWQKALGVSWIPLANEPLARSFMNYPYNVPGGTTAFFSDFEFRFSDGELLFMRHAPFRFVEQGNAAWFDHHGFQQADFSPEPKFSLTIECPTTANAFEFLEPVVVHLTLKNISGQPQLVDENLLATADCMTLIIKKRGRPARELLPYSQRCFKKNQIVLQPNGERKDSVFLVGRNGWDIAEPGYYTVQASIDISGEDIVSQPITIRVAPPRGYDEEYVAQDFFSDEVGRVLNFDGSRYLESANSTLLQVVDQLPKSKAAIHSRVALAAPKTSQYKLLDFEGEIHRLKVGKPDHREASELLSVLVKDAPAAVATLGQVDYDYYFNRFKNLLEEAKKAAKHR